MSLVTRASDRVLVDERVVLSLVEAMFAQLEATEFDLGDQPLRVAYYGQEDPDGVDAFVRLSMVRTMGEAGVASSTDGSEMVSVEVGIECVVDAPAARASRLLVGDLVSRVRRALYGVTADETGEVDGQPDTLLPAGHRLRLDRMRVDHVQDERVPQLETAAVVLYGTVEVG